MKKIIAIISLAIFFSPLVCFAAIAFDSTGSGSQSPTTNLTWTHTTSGSNRLLYVFLTNLTDLTDPSPAVTYDGVAMTQIAKILGNGSNGYEYVYLLTAPAIGANTVSVTTSSSFAWSALSYSVNGANQSIIYGSTDNILSAVPTIGATSQSMTVATICNNSWAVYFNRDNSATTNNRTGDANTIFRVGVSTKQFGIWDSNTAITPAGNYTMTVNTAGGSDTIIGGASIIASISPTGCAPPTSLSTSILGLVRAFWW